MIAAESKREHAAFCRVTIAGNLPHRGAALIRWWFSNLAADRRSRPWTSRQVAHQATLPMTVVNQAFRDARDEGLVELADEGWWWRG